MNDLWHYATQGQQRGPVSRAELDRLIAQGALQPDDLVWSPSLPDWQAVSTVPGVWTATARTSASQPQVRPPPLINPPAPAPLGYAGAPVGDYPPTQPDAGTQWLIPVGRSGWAIAAGYLGLFRVIPIFAPIALAISLVALSDLKKKPHLSGKGRAVFGLVMGSIFTLLLMFALLAAVG